MLSNKDITNIAFILDTSFDIIDTEQKQGTFKTYGHWDKYMKDGFSGFYGETDKGYMLRYTYGTLNSLMTPYGNIRIIGDNSTKSGFDPNILHKKLDEKFKLEHYIDKYNDVYYKIRYVNNELIENTTEIVEKKISWEEKLKKHNILKNDFKKIRTQMKYNRKIN